MPHHLRRSARIALALTLAAVQARAGATSQATGVSPGETGRIAEVEARCPTFSWAATSDARGYELVLFRLANDGSGAAAEPAPILHKAFDEGVTAWTPAVGDCLERGEDYAWTVRAIGVDEREAVANQWSEPRLFRVSALPSLAELDRALEVLRAYRDAQHPAVGSTVALRDSTEAAPARSGRPSPTRSSEISEGGTPATAIRGETDSTVEGSAGVFGHAIGSSGFTHGVIGMAESLEGIGVFAANTADGVDLLLDGPIPTAVTEAGIDRASGSPASFSLGNSGGGGFSLSVGGSVDAALFVGDGSSLTDVANLAANSVGPTQIQPGAVGSVHLAFGAVSAAYLANDSVTTDKLATNAVTEPKIATGAISTRTLAVGAVQSISIADQSVAQQDLANNSVSSINVIDGSLFGVDLGAQTVTGANVAPATLTGFHIQDFSLGTTDFAIGSVAGAQIADGSVSGTDIGFQTVTGSNVAPSTLTGNHIADLTIGTADLDVGAVGTLQIADGAVATVDLAFTPYWSKSQLYFVLATTMVLSGGNDGATVTCADNNDLALAGSCFTNCPICNIYYDYLSPEADPAEHTCVLHNPTGSTISVSARIWCINVPGS